jgi:hypothetical protein
LFLQSEDIAWAYVGEKSYCCVYVQKLNGAKAQVLQFDSIYKGTDTLTVDTERLVSKLLPLDLSKPLLLKISRSVEETQTNEVNDSSKALPPSQDDIGADQISDQSIDNAGATHAGMPKLDDADPEFSPVCLPSSQVPF